MFLKNIQREKSNLFAYLRFCVFCACEEKKIENRKKRKVPIMQCKCTGLTKYANISAYILTYTDLVSPVRIPT